jgi:hypothetical protein
MASDGESQELYHEIFGSVLDRRELTPYLLRNCDDYRTSLCRATLMMGNRGFAVQDGELAPGELERAAGYVNQAVGYFNGALFPTVSEQLRNLSLLGSPQRSLYESSIACIDDLGSLLSGGPLASLIAEDPRHLLMMASAAKYPHLFRGHPSAPERVPPRWRMASCSVLKMCHLIKAVEEDSQDIYDYARLGIFFESRGIPLDGLFGFPWSAPPVEPDDDNARRAFVKLSAFFGKLNASVTSDGARGGLVFNSGDGVSVRIVEVKARLKSPESMFAKLGKDAAEEAYNIRDILAVTFLLERREDSLTLFHALQKQGVILQETTASASITQTLFDTPADMSGAVSSLMRSLARREGVLSEPDPEAVRRNAEAFFRSLGTNAEANPHSSGQHRKFQCKLNFSVPVRHDAGTGRILIPGTPEFAGAGQDSGRASFTRQHTLPVELRISDIHSWEKSELKGEAHHSAYKCRQLLVLMDRLFSPLFSFPPGALAQLRRDQDELFG